MKIKILSIVISLFMIDLYYVNAQQLSIKNPKETREIKVSHQKKNRTLELSKSNTIVLSNEKLLKLKKNIEKELQKTDKAIIDWTEQHIEAIGSSLIDNKKYRNKAQAYAMAIQGAKLDAQKKILEAIKEIKITADIIKIDSIKEKNVIYKKIEGSLKNAILVGEPNIKKGKVLLKMRINLYGQQSIANLLIKELKQDENKLFFYNKRSNGKAIIFSIIDEDSNFIHPLLFPVFYNKDNKVVFDLKNYFNIDVSIFPKIIKTDINSLERVGLGIEQILFAKQDKNGRIIIDKNNLEKINSLKDEKDFIKIDKFLFVEEFER